MASIKVRPVRDDLSFGARITGVTEETLKDASVRKQIFDTFEDRGILVFEGVEPSSKMQVAISDVFGPLKKHPVKWTYKVNEDTMPGVIENRNDPEKHCIVDTGDGKPRLGWLPWHFDHCYNNELNRGGVLRIVEIPPDPDGGKTGFLDGIALYRSLPAELVKKLEGQKIIYTMNLLYKYMRFGKNFRIIQDHPDDILAQAKETPRAIHPAVWTRKSGEKVFHLSPWMSVGIEGHENPEGDALLEAVSQAINAAGADPSCTYFHDWKPTDMIIWDNWRMLHMVNGWDPQYVRCAHRTTIQGDYGLGRFENNDQGHYAVLEKAV